MGQKKKDTSVKDTSLATKSCIPCKGSMPKLSPQECKNYLAELNDGWKVVEDHHIEKEYRFNDFKSALAFVDKVGQVAEQEGHHPDIYLAWGKVKISLWTHKINGLSESDFILAAKCDAVEGMSD